MSRREGMLGVRGVEITMNTAVAARLVGIGLLYSPISVAQETAAPTSVEYSESRWGGSIGSGVIALASDHGRSPLNGNRSLGVAVYGQLGRQVGNKTRLGVGSTLGISEPQRMALFWEQGIELGSWTTQAYRDVTAWSTEVGNASFFAIPLAMVAYGVLMVPLSLSGLLLMSAPFAAISFTSMDVSASYHFVELNGGPYVECGLGLTGHWLSETDIIGGGLSPVVGTGIELEHLMVGTRLFFSPHNVENGSDMSNLRPTALTFTIGVGG